MQEAISIESFADILDLWDTDTEVARLCQIPPNNVTQWRRRKKIPAKYWRQLIADLAENQEIDGLTVDVFLDLEETYVAPRHRTMAQKADSRETTRRWRERKKAGMI